MKAQTLALLLLSISPFTVAEIPMEKKFPGLENQPSFDCSGVPLPDPSNETGYSTADITALHKVADGERRHGFAGGTVIFILEFDDDGLVKNIDKIKSTRNFPVDNASYNWARCTRTIPGKFKSVKLPISF